MPSDRQRRRKKTHEVPMSSSSCSLAHCDLLDGGFRQPDQHEICEKKNVRAATTEGTRPGRRPVLLEEGGSLAAAWSRLCGSCQRYAALLPLALHRHSKNTRRKKIVSMQKLNEARRTFGHQNTRVSPSVARPPLIYRTRIPPQEGTFRTATTHRDESHGRRGEGGPPEAAGQEDDQDHRQGLESAARRALHPGHLPGAGGRCR